MKMKLDYGSGSQPKEGFLSSDFCGAPNYDYFIQDYRVIGAKDGSFDVIHCRNVIHHIPEQDLPILFKEFDRLLKPGGRLIISEPRKEFHKENLILDIIWYRYLKNERKISLPLHYVDWRKYANFFSQVNTKYEFNNEIVTYKKVKKTSTQEYTMWDMVSDAVIGLLTHQ
ncbi:MULTISPECIES: class I SAM-dependent methyltransferase [unclassified Exiguobacterium]|uniref:class I SAM-dependent methyltransferase n=1 Tax=unclassified Exiguobacterium TaxID=2644629 RepID=UPI0020352473|nr:MULTISPECIES: class I SAM-dependent methyltransferase [unclassified Exiguobacterium]